MRARMSSTASESPRGRPHACGPCQGVFFGEGRISSDSVTRPQSTGPFCIVVKWNRVLIGMGRRVTANGDSSRTKQPTGHDPLRSTQHHNFHFAGDLTGYGGTPSFSVSCSIAERLHSTRPPLLPANLHVTLSTNWRRSPLTRRDAGTAQSLMQRILNPNFHLRKSK